MRKKRIILNWGSKLILVLIFTLLANYSFAGDITWNGNTNSSWNLGSNWDGGVVPSANDRAIIPTGLPTYPIVTGGSINIKDIKLTGTGSLTIKGGTINVSGKLEFLNTGSPYGTVIQSGGTINLRDLKFSGAGTFIQNENDGNSLLTISHDYKNDNSGTFNSTGGTIQFTGSGGGRSDFSTGTNQFFNVIIDPWVNPKFDNAGGGSISVAGNFTNNNSGLDVTNSLFTFNGSGNQTIYSAANPVPNNTTFGDLTIDKPSGTIQLSSDLSVEGTFTEQSGNLDENGYTLWVAGSPMPVELVSFSAVILDNEIKLTWKTVTEINNYGFEVERQVGSKQTKVRNWEIIGFVEGHGNTNSPKDYNFSDSDVSFAGTYQYRLKQIDNDGSYEYSKMIEVDFTSPINFKLKQNFPNPFNPSTTISFSLPVSNNVSLKIINPLGEKIVTLIELYLEAGVHTYIFNADGFASGIYVYQLSTSGATQTRKMLYLK